MTFEILSRDNVDGYLAYLKKAMDAEPEGMTAEFFDTVCREAACDARRNMQIVTRTRQASDHPTALSFPEGEYLKGLVLQTTK